VLAAARAGARGRVIAVFEPHRYSRVHDLFGDFCACFSEADNVIVAPLYSAGEQPLRGIDQHYMAEGIRKTGHPSAIAIDSVRELPAAIRRMVRPNDTVICLGAGTSTEWAHALPDWLAAEEPRRANAV
jgi:UDP-N-acetylmuramate--alanine ligase